MSAEATVLPDAQRGNVLQAAVTGGISACFATLIVLCFTRNVNWDEFYYLSFVHDALNGRLDRPMQTFHVHFFGWLARVPGGEVDQIAAARLVMVAMVAVTCVGIQRIGARLADPFAGRVAVLAYLASGFVLAHGASFRTDPIAASLLMTALALMLTTPMRIGQMVAVALLCAVAVLVTIKSGLWLPAFLAALLYRWPDRAVVLRCLIAGLLALGLAALLLLLHSATLQPSAENATASNARAALDTTFLAGPPFPRWNEARLWALLSLSALLLAALGLAGARPRRQAAVLAGFALPLASIILYRNAFPYFFPFITAPLMLVVAVGAARLDRADRLAAPVVGMLALALVQTVLALREDNALQRATLAEVHRLFPDPVPYIDQHRMLSSFPGQGFFMSTWGIEAYLRAEVPVFGAILAEHQPPLLLANREELLVSVRDGAAGSGPLLPDDRQVLHDSYLHYDGAIWLAGRALTGAGADQTFAMPFAGRYRLQATAPVSIDGVTVAPDEVLILDGGAHVLSAPIGLPIRLIWATPTASASEPDLPETGLYSGFWRL
jgi:hypothetical protein